MHNLLLSVATAIANVSQGGNLTFLDVIPGEASQPTASEEVNETLLNATAIKANVPNESNLTVRLAKSAESVRAQPNAFDEVKAARFVVTPVTIASLPPSLATDDCFLLNTSYMSELDDEARWHYPEGEIGSAILCQGWCWTVDNCTFFSYAEATGTCRLFGVAARAVNESGSVAGPRQCSPLAQTALSGSSMSEDLVVEVYDDIRAVDPSMHIFMLIMFILVCTFLCTRMWGSPCSRGNRPCGGLVGAPHYRTITSAQSDEEDEGTSDRSYGSYPGISERGRDRGCSLESAMASERRSLLGGFLGPEDLGYWDRPAH